MQDLCNFPLTQAIPSGHKPQNRDLSRINPKLLHLTKAFRHKITVYLHKQR